MLENLGKEGLGAFRLGIVEEFCSVSGFQDLAAIHEEDPVRDTSGKAHLMCDAHENLVDHFRIECRSRFVEQHDFRIERQRSRNRGTLLLSAG
jgi:hypothetical protein